MHQCAFRTGSALVQGQKEAEQTFFMGGSKDRRQGTPASHRSLLDAVQEPCACQVHVPAGMYAVNSLQ